MGAHTTVPIAMGLYGGTERGFVMCSWSVPLPTYLAAASIDIKTIVWIEYIHGEPDEL